MQQIRFWLAAEMRITLFLALFSLVAYFSPFSRDLSTGALVAVERFAWWFHIAGILAFAVYVTYSKHLHIFLAFPQYLVFQLET